MPTNDNLSETLELCGFITGERQESRSMNILGIILRLQRNPRIPLKFNEIYSQLVREDPNTNLTKAWVHRVLKSLVEAELIRFENPTAHRKRYIADVNTIMAGLEKLKTQKLKDLELKESGIRSEKEKLSALDCGKVAQDLIESVTGRKEEVSSRIVRGVDELHRVLRYNILDLVKKGDIIRATLLWVGPWIDDTVKDRVGRFFEAAERGADIRYLVTTDLFKLESNDVARKILGELGSTVRKIMEMRERGIKFDARFYAGPKTYNQISFNRDSTALIINENPVTATWITRKFNPDLIDNAVKSFDNDWKKAKSIFELTPKDFEDMKVGHSDLIRKMLMGDK